jgi:hypothetical protein
MGVPWQDTAYVGSLIGIKTALNEFVAYAQFASDLGSGVVLSPRSAVILTYALLGFANFSSIAIQIGGIGGLAPERRGEIARFGLRAMIAGNPRRYVALWRGCWCDGRMGGWAHGQFGHRCRRGGARAPCRPETRDRDRAV